MELFTSWINIARVFALMGAVQGLILFVITFRNRKYKSNLYISWLIFILTTEMFQSIFINKSNILQYPLFWVLEFRTFLAGPLSYFYFRSTLFESDKRWLPFWVHSIPAWCYLCFMLAMFLIKEPHLLNSDIFDTFNGNPPIYVSVLDFSGLSSGLIYSVLNYFVFYRYKKENRKNNRFKTPIQWLNVLFLISLLLWTVSWSTFLFRKEGVSERDISGTPYAILVASYVLAMYAAAFFSQKYPTLFGADEDRRSRARENLGLDENQLKDHVDAIITFMKNEKPYLDESLNLDQMAKSLRLHRNTVSFLINEYFQKSFKEFINEYRLAHSMELIKSGDERTILQIAFDSGFSSKSAFNKVFKEKTGLTPGEFKDTSLISE